MKLLKKISDYKIKILLLLFNHEPQTSGTVFKFLNDLMGDNAPSRASVIIFLNSLVDSKDIVYYSETGKGGFHRVYTMEMNPTQFINKQYKDTQAQLDKLLGVLQ